MYLVVLSAHALAREHEHQVQLVGPLIRGASKRILRNQIDWNLITCAQPGTQTHNVSTIFCNLDVLSESAAIVVYVVVSVVVVFVVT